MAELMNWPPSRGKNPHTHELKYLAGQIESQDLERPRRRGREETEKSLVEEIEANDWKSPPISPEAAASPPQAIRTRPKARPTLAGKWKVWVQVKDVLGLSIEQADRILRAVAPDNPFDTWFRYEPRLLQVDITYPLAVGVRLVVHPLKMKSTLCAACGPEKKSRVRTVMSPGYFMWVVAQEYARIYQEHEKYGVWGHAIDDLGFEFIGIDEDGIVELGIGS